MCGKAGSSHRSDIAHEAWDEDSPFTPVVYGSSSGRNTSARPGLNRSSSQLGLTESDTIPSEPDEKEVTSVSLGNRKAKRKVRRDRKISRANGNVTPTKSRRSKVHKSPNVDIITDNENREDWMDHGLSHVTLGNVTSLIPTIDAVFIEESLQRFVNDRLVELMDNDEQHYEVYYEDWYRIPESEYTETGVQKSWAYYSERAEQATFQTKES